MKTTVTIAAVMLVFALFSATASAGCLSSCGSAGSLGSSIAGSMKLNYNKLPVPVFQNMNLGKLGLTYKFTAPQARLGAFHMPHAGYNIPLKQMPMTNIEFHYTYIPLRAEPCTRC